MLPVEIFDKISSHLCFTDIVSLCQVVPLSETTLKDVLFKECAYFDPEYSQEETWKRRLLKYAYNDTKPFTNDLRCKTFTDTPLPGDFHCLCKNIDQENGLVYTDTGLFINDDFLNLSDSKDTPPMPPKATFKEGYPNIVHYNGMLLRTPGELLRQKCRGDLVATVFYNLNHTNLIINDISRGRDDETHGVASFEREVSFRLQVVGQRVLFSHSGDSYSTVKMSSGDILDIPDIPRRNPWPFNFAGMLLYDGHVFDVVMGPGPTVQSTKSLTPIVQKYFSSHYFDVEQDTLYTRYGVVFDGYGLVAGVIDLKAHTVLSLAAPGTGAVDLVKQTHLKLVGVSGGCLGVWQYSVEYLKEKHLLQHETKLPYQVRVLLESNEEEEEEEIWISLSNVLMEMKMSVFQNTHRSHFHYHAENQNEDYDDMYREWDRVAE